MFDWYMGYSSYSHSSIEVRLGSQQLSRVMLVMWHVYMKRQVINLKDMGHGEDIVTVLEEMPASLLILQ